MQAKPGVWDELLHRMLWEQLDHVRDMRVLDFGSGAGVTADHLAAWNEVTAIEPDRNMLTEHTPVNRFQQLVGSAELLAGMPEGCFDAVLCHNVLEYVPERETVMRELTRVLAPGGTLSLVKHNRYGRVMQMAVLLDRPEEAQALLDGADSQASRFGTIRYYEDADPAVWCPDLELTAAHGIRTFWDLQQEQEKHGDATWQERMLALERRVSDLADFRRIAFFHHLLFRKKDVHSGK